MLVMNAAAVPTSAKSSAHAVMIALRVVAGLSFESMKSTFSLRPATPPLAFTDFTAALTPSTVPWKRPGLSGLSTSATTAMRISSAVTPMSLSATALAAAFDCAATGPARVATPASARHHAVPRITKRFMGLPPRDCSEDLAPASTVPSKINTGTIDLVRA